jgi:hypothetical protein
MAEVAVAAVLVPAQELLAMAATAVMALFL